MAGVTNKLRGPGKGVKLRDTRTVIKKLVGAGCPLEDIEIEITPRSALVRVKRGGGERKEPKIADTWDEAIAKTAVPVR